MRIVAAALLWLCVCRACVLLNNCNVDKAQGKCDRDGVSCNCNPGFLGDSCAVPPAQLVVGSVVPGFVPLGGVVYYRVSINDYNLNDEVVVEPTGDGSIVVYAAIGKVPAPDAMGVFTFQFKSAEPDDVKRKTLQLLSLASLGGPEDQNLYVAVQAVTVVQGNGVQFEVFHWTGKSDRIFGGAVDDWAVFASLALVGLLCCSLCALGVVVCIARRGDVDLNEGATALQKQKQEQAAQEKAKKLYGDDYQNTNAPGYAGNGNATTYAGGGGSVGMAPPRNGGSFSGASGNTFSGSTFSGMPPEYPGGGRSMSSAISYNSGAYDAQW